MKIYNFFKFSKNLKNFQNFTRPKNMKILKNQKNSKNSLFWFYKKWPPGTKNTQNIFNESPPWQNHIQRGSFGSTKKIISSSKNHVFSNSGNCVPPRNLTGKFFTLKKMKKLNYLFFQKKTWDRDQKNPPPGAPNSKKSKISLFFDPREQEIHIHFYIFFSKKSKNSKNSRNQKKGGPGGGLRVSDVFFDPPQIEHFRPSDRNSNSNPSKLNQTDSNENTNFKTKFKIFQNIPNPSNTHHAHKKYFPPRNINFSKLKNKYFQTKKFLSKTLDRENTLKTQKK